MAKNNIITVHPTDDIDKIQAILKNAGNIKFEKGTYDVTQILTIYSNTTIDLTGATLVRKNPSHIFRGYVNPNISYMYNAVKNVSIKGGTFVGDGLKQSGSIMGFLHADNILLDNITFKHTYYSHAIDLPACKNVTIHKCKFSGRIIDPKGSYREEIQYDVAFYCGYPYYNKNAKVYNGNHCINLTIDSCEFSDSNFCIGTHTESSSSNKKHKNIKIINCKAKGNVIKYAGCFAKIINTDGFIIKGNDISQFTKGIVITSCGRFYNNNGNIISSKPSGKTGSCNGDIEDNNIYNCKGSSTAGIQTRSEFDDLIHSDITIKNNNLDLNNAKAKNDIDISKAKNINIIDNTTKLKVKVDKKTTNNVIMK
jgi:hypothetical protein